MRLDNLSDLQPTRNQLLVEAERPPEKTKGGILLPEATRQDKDAIGVVLACGPEIMDDRIKVGARVLYTTFAGQDLVVNHKDYKLITEIDVAAVIASNGGS